MVQGKATDLERAINSRKIIDQGKVMDLRKITN